MDPHRPHRLMAVPPTLHTRMEIAKAIDSLTAKEADERTRQRAEIDVIRRDLEEIPGLLRRAFVEYRVLMAAELKKYSPDQPRVPKGNADGGRWTNEGAGGSSIAPSIYGSEIQSRSYPRFATLDISSRATQTDSPILFVGEDGIAAAQNSDEAPKPETQLAGGPEDDESETRIGREPVETTLRQQALLQGMEVRLQSALSRIGRIDPTWKPTVGLHEQSAEGLIRSTQDAAEEAEQYLSRLGQLALPRDPRTGELILSREAKTGDPFIDYTTEKLQDVLDDVTDRLGHRPDLSPQQYGTLVHTEFAKALRAVGLRGIDPEDVERTFGVEPDAPYGAEHSVRTDAALRDDNGDIIVIYDVKTGRGMRQLHAIKLRLRTGSEATVPIIEIYPDRDPVWKFRAAKGPESRF